MRAVEVKGSLLRLCDVVSTGVTLLNAVPLIVMTDSGAMRLIDMEIRVMRGCHCRNRFLGVGRRRNEGEGIVLDKGTGIAQECVGVAVKVIEHFWRN